MSGSGQIAQIALSDQRQKIAGGTLASRTSAAGSDAYCLPAGLTQHSGFNNKPNVPSLDYLSLLVSLASSARGEGGEKHEAVIRFSGLRDGCIACLVVHDSSTGSAGGSRECADRTDRKWRR